MAIKRYQTATGFENCLCFLGQRLKAGIRKSRCQSADGLELANEHGWGRRRGLTNLIEGEFGEAIEPHWWHPYTKPTAGVSPIPFERRALSQSE